MNNINMNDITIGFDAVGAEDYLVNLNNLLIQKTKEKLDDISGIEMALQSGWQGVSEENFMANFKTAELKVQATLDELESVMRTQFANIANSWQDQDVDMVPLDN